MFFDILKREKLPFFRRGYSMVLVKNWPFLHLLFFGQHRPGKCVLRYATAKRRVCKLLKQEVQKVEKLLFFPRG